MYRSTPVKVPKDGYSESVLDTWGNLNLAVAPHHAHARVAVSNRDPTSLGADNTCPCTSSQTGQQSQKMTYEPVDQKTRHPEMRSFQGWGYWNIGEHCIDQAKHRKANASAHSQDARTLFPSCHPPR